MHFSRNITILLALRAVRWFLVIMPIITIFYREHGLSMREVFLIQVAFSLSVVLLEVPTGYFSDVVWRKKSLIVGMTCSIFWLALYCLGHGFYGFFIAEMLLWLGASFISGTDVAMMYDTLIDEWKEWLHKKIQWYAQSLSSISEASASLLGGFLAVISISLPFYVMLGVFILMYPLVFFLREPHRHRHENREGMIHGIWKIIRHSLHDHKEIKWLIFLSGSFWASTLVMTWFLQSYFTLVSVPLQYFGVLWCIFILSIVPFSHFAHSLEAYLGRRNSLICMTLLPICGYFLLGTFVSFWALCFVFFFYFARWFGTVVLQDYINKLVSSDIRATVLSLQSLMFRLVFVIVGPLMGWVADIYSLSAALLLSGIVFALFGLVSLLGLAHHRALDI